MAVENPSWPKEELERFRRGAERRVYARFMRNVLTDAPRYHPTGYEDMIADYVGSGLYWPVPVMTHKSHAAGPEGMEEADYIRQTGNIVLPEEAHFTGILIVVAHNLGNGQNEEIDDWWHLAKPIMDDFDVEPVHVVRKKDAAEAGVELTEESKVMIQTKYSQLVPRRQIPLLLAEGTVDSGRWKEGGQPGEIKGMREIPAKSIALLSQHIRRKGKLPLYIPIGTHGENRIYDPETEKATDIAKKTAVMRVFPSKREEYPHLMHVIAGYPVPHDVIVRDLGERGDVRPEVLATVIGELLAALVPDNERGVYSGEPQYLPRLHTPVFTHDQAQQMYHFSL